MKVFGQILPDWREFREKLWIIFEILCSFVEVFINAFIKMQSQLYGVKPVPQVRIRPQRGIIKFYIDKKQGQEAIDERIAKIDVARENLTDALAAMDQLREYAQENKRDLEYLNEKIQKAEASKANVSDELSALKQMSAFDSVTVRRVLGLPTRTSVWIDRCVAFVLGILASTIASFVYAYLMKRLNSHS
jgi:uncharacterized protein YhaN